MKLINFIVIAAACLAAAGAQAQSPREQLKQMVEQLQKTPDDGALREKIIKLAKTVKPAPAVPEEAERREGRAKFAFKNAKSNEDYLSAAREYEEAARVAPWVTGYYADLCTIYEKAERYVAAKRYCEFSMIGLTNPALVSETRQRIAGLEFGIETAAKVASAKKAEQDRIAKEEEEKRRAEQAKRDVIAQIKNAVRNRHYELKMPSSSESRQMAGVSDNQLFNGGKYYMFEIDHKDNVYYWKFYDDRAELWAFNNNSLPAYTGRPMGPDVRSVQWSNGFGTAPPTWGRFDLTRDGRLYVAPIGGAGQKPVKDSEGDPDRIYLIEIYDPK